MELILAIQRLMDTDVLLPEEGKVLLAEIDEIESQECFTAAPSLLPMLEALTHTDRLNKSVAQEARAIVRQILRGESDPNGT
jgi:hypothetical protein